MTAQPTTTDLETETDGGFLPRLPRRLGRALLAWYDRWVQRQFLAELDDRMLADIGVSREQRDRECRRLL